MPIIPGILPGMLHPGKITLLLLQALICLSPLWAETPQPSFTVKWGLILPLSGPAARAGVDIRRGFELAFSDLKDGRVKHEFVAEDSEYMSRGAVSAAHKLMSIDKVDVVVALWDTADPVAPLAEQYDVIHTSIRWNSNIADKFKNTFTFESTYKQYSEKLIALFKRIGIRSFSILNHESNGWNLAMDEMINAAKIHGIEVKSAQSYLPDTGSDYKPFATRALKDNPEIIVVDDVGETLEVITKQIRVLRANQRVTGYLGYPVDLSLFEGEYFIDQLSLDERFAERYKKQFNEPIYSRAQLAYDLAMIVAKAFDKFQTKPNTSHAVEAIKSIHEYDGMSGKIIATNNNKVFQTQTVEKRVQNGKAVAITQ